MATAETVAPPPGFVDDLAPPEGFVEDAAPPPGFELDQPRGATAASADSSPAGAGSIPAPATGMGDVQAAQPAIVEQAAQERERIASLPPWAPERIRATESLSELQALETEAQRRPLAEIPKLKPDAMMGAGAPINALISTAESQLTPENAQMLAGAPVGVATGLMKPVLAYFATTMGKEAIESLKGAYEAVQAGDLGTAGERLASAGVMGLFTAGAAKGMGDQRPIGGRLAEEAASAEATRLTQEAKLSETQRQTDAELDSALSEAQQMAQQPPIPNAEQIPQATQPDVPVLNAEGTPTGERQVPAAEGGAGVSTRGQGAPLRTEGVTAQAGISEGPGAAAASEPLVSYEKRRFGERFQEDKTIDPAIREATGNQYYEPIPNLATVREAEAIIERRGTDESARLVRDESFPMDHRVRSTMAQGLIKKLNQSYSEATKAGDTKAAEGFLGQAVDTAEYLSELGTKLGQGVQSFAIWSRLTPEGMLMAAKRTIRKARAKAGPEGEIPKDLDPAEVAELTRMAAEIEATPEGFQRNEKMTEFLGKIADLKGVDPADIPTALWYANILSGYSTQLVNTVDTGLNVFSEAAAMAASHPTAVPEIMSGLYRGMLKGGLEAKETLRTGRGRTENKLQVSPILERTRFGEKGGVPISEQTALGRVLKAGFEKKPAKILNLWKYPLRAMVASDTVFYNSFKEARSRVLARVMAKKEGLSGDALFQRIDEILNQTPEKIAAAEQQAQAEGLTGARYKRRVREIQEQGRPEELVSNADEAAQIATYNHDPTGTLGVIAAKIGEITQNVPLARAIVPFTRIVANVANRGLDYTPWGYKRLFFGQHGGERFATKPPVGEAYRAQLVKATAGTIGMTALAALDSADVIQVTSSGPQNPDERKQMQNAGWKPYSVKVGDTWISYQYTPLNLGLAMVGHYRDAIRYNKLDEKDAQTRLAYGMLKAGSTLFDMSFLSGLSSFMETMSGATSSSKAAGRMLARTASSVVVPNLFKQVDRLFDPTLYDAPTVQQMLIRETPVARSLALEPMLNVLGEPIKLSNNRFFSFDKNDPVWKLIVEKQAFVPVPSKTRKVGKRPITPKEYRELIEVSGKEIRSYIQGNLDSLRSATPEEAQKLVNAAATKSRDAAMKRFSEKSPKS